MPCDGPSAISSVSASPSGSVQVSGTDTLEPTRTVSATSSQAGGREIVTLTVAGADAAVPSEAP